MGQRRSKLDRHGAELLALRRAGATLAQLTRWLRFQRDTVVAATTVGRWLEHADVRYILDVDGADDFDAAAALDRQLRYPRLAASCIDERGYHILGLRDRGATIGECHRAMRDDRGARVDHSTFSRWHTKPANGQP